MIRLLVDTSAYAHPEEALVEIGAMVMERFGDAVASPVHLLVDVDDGRHIVRDSTEFEGAPHLARALDLLSDAIRIRTLGRKVSAFADAAAEALQKKADR